MRAVNLLPSDYRPAKQASVGGDLSKHTVALGGAAAAVAVAAILGVSWQSASTSAKSSQSELDGLNARIAAVSLPANSTDQTVRARIQQVTSIDAARVSWDGFLRKFARVLPEDVWLTSLQVQEAAPVAAAPATTGTTSTSTSTTSTPAPAATPGAPTGFTISGFTYSQASVARLMRRLSLLPWLSDVSLQSSTLTVVGARSVFQFSIVGGVNPLPAKEAS